MDLPAIRIYKEETCFKKCPTLIPPERVLLLVSLNNKLKFFLTKIVLGPPKKCALRKVFEFTLKAFSASTHEWVQDLRRQRPTVIHTTY